MRNSPFNELSDAQAEALALLIEECGEVIQAATKILRHGTLSVDPTLKGNPPTNRASLTKELGHLRCATWICETHGLIRESDIQPEAEAKARKIGKWLHHARATGLVS